MMKTKAVMVWSGGKDSALALHKVLSEGVYELVALLSTFSNKTKRLSMHGVAVSVIREQAKQIGLPLKEMYFEEATHEAYEDSLRNEIEYFKKQGVSAMIFGDIFLEDLRRYREKNLIAYDMQAVFPLWKENTEELIQKFIQLKFKTICCCADDSKLSSGFVGKEIDKDWVDNLPKNVDKCGENGEYHTCCFDGPNFREKIRLKIGEKVQKTYHFNGLESSFSFVDLSLE